MMTTIFFIAAIACVVIGHIFKIKRWGLFISVYEDPDEANLLNAMTVGHAVNAVLPFRVGDIFRVGWAGRKMKNGYSLALATVIADLYVDLLTVGIMFFGLSLIGKGGDDLLRVARIYGTIFVIIIPLTAVCFALRKYIKKIISLIAGIFNENIEFRILYVSYLCIASVKDIITKIDKIKFCLFSVGIWSGYIASYAFFAEVLQGLGFDYSTSEVFKMLFSKFNIYNSDVETIPIWAVYILLPLMICWLISLILQKISKPAIYVKKVLPQMSRADRLAFLKTYYEEENREHIQAYLDLNRDVTIVEDNSAGSNASTVLAMKADGKLYYRKYAFDEDGEKLQEQIDWIKKHQSDIPLPVIVEEKKGKNYVTYDMHSYSSTIGLFRCIHTMPVEYSWGIIRLALDEIGSGLHSKNARAAEETTIEKYIQTKVSKNLGIILQNNKYIARLEQNSEIKVNGVPFRTIGFYKDMLSENHMQEIFKNDKYSDIHGDLTIENIVCLLDNSEINPEEFEAKCLPRTYYFIDPNTGNVHDSPFLDYAKLLQSLHGNYEFLMMVKEVVINKDSVNYSMMKSEAYGEIYSRYKKYLMERFSREEVLSIYYHEIIHWLRLMPYKIRKNEKLAVVFYTGLLIVLNDVWEFEHEQK